MHLKKLHSGWLNTCMNLGIENVVVDLVNISLDFMLLGSKSKPAVGEFTYLSTETCMPNNHELTDVCFK